MNGDFVNIFKIDDNTLKIAKDYVTHNKLVAFPTETVYGLGGNAFSDSAIKAIYAAKGRPSDNPLIVHVHKDYDILSLVYDAPYAERLRKAFLPGPLTMVYKSKNKVSPLVSCGLETLAIRVPSHEGAQRFLSFANIPVAAPSANKSKHTSPVTAMHVYEDFGNEIPMILDGGRSEGGIESTVLDVTGDVPVILRKGLITAEMIKSVVGACEYAGENSDLNKRSPGTKYRHYCPKTHTKLFEKGDVSSATQFYDDVTAQGKTAMIMCDGRAAEKICARRVFDLGIDGNTMANRLYYGLHEGENFDYLIGIRFDIDDEVKSSVENRFLKAFG